MAEFRRSLTLFDLTLVAVDAVKAAMGGAGGAVVAAAIAISALGTAGIYTLTGPRLYWAMADRGLFFRGVAELHPRWATPVRAIVLQTAWACVPVLVRGQPLQALAGGALLAFGVPVHAAWSRP